MKVKSLENTEFSEIVSCFLKAFKNYYVEFPNEPEYFRKRWESAGVRYDLSYGMFDGHKLVGFIIHAIDHRSGEWIAYNTGTGVLPEYRGRKIVDQIYDLAFPELVKNNISKCSLEVITDNDAAIKAYERIGFKKTKTYKCFKGSFFHHPESLANLNEVRPELFDWSLLPNQEFYSWDNQLNSVQNGDYSYFILGNDEPKAVFIINTNTGYIPQLECLVDDDKTWKELFEAIASVRSEVKINNVDVRQENKIHHLKKAGLINHIDQFEMERNI